VERLEGRRVNDMFSSATSHDGRSPVRDRRDEELEPEDTARGPWGRFRWDDRLACLLSCRILSGEGGPSTAGSKIWLKLRGEIFPGEWLGRVGEVVGDRLVSMASLVTTLGLRFDVLYSE
jgi:hypothetical protein